MARRRAAAAALLAIAHAEEKCDSDPTKFKPPPVYKLVSNPPWCEAPYSAPPGSMSECTAVVRRMIERNEIRRPPRNQPWLLWAPDVTAKPAPSAMLGRNLPTGCYWYYGRQTSGYDPLYWNGGPQLHGTPTRTKEQARRSEAAAVCKHDEAAAAVAALSSAEWGPDILRPATTLHQAAEVLHILSGDEEAHLQARDLLGGGGTDPFVDVAQEHSLCTTAPLGGALGIVLRGQLVEPLNSAIFDGEMHESSLSPVVWQKDGTGTEDGKPLGRHKAKGVAIYAGVKSELGFHNILVRWVGERPEEEPRVLTEQRKPPHISQAQRARAARRDAGEAGQLGSPPPESGGAPQDPPPGQRAGEAAPAGGGAPLSGSIDELREAKRAAIEAEDYARAAELKAAIRALEQQ